MLYMPLELAWVYHYYTCLMAGQVPTKHNSLPPTHALYALGVCMSVPLLHILSGGEIPTKHNSLDYWSPFINLLTITLD